MRSGRRIVLNQKEVMRGINKFMLDVVKAINQIEEGNIVEYQEKMIKEGKKVNDCD